MNESWMSWEGALESLRQVPPVDLVCGSPAIVTRQSFNPSCAISNQQQMFSMGETQVGFSFQEEPFPKVPGCFHATIPYALLEPVASMLGGETFKLFAGREHAQAHFEPVAFFPLRSQEGAIDFGQDQFPLLGVASGHFAMLEDGFLQIVFFLDDHRSFPLYPAVQTAVIDRCFHKALEQERGLAIRQPCSQGNGLSEDPGAGMLTGCELQQLIQRAAVPSISLAHLPTFKLDPAKTRQQMQLSAFILAIPALILLQQLIFQCLARLQQQLLPSLLERIPDFVFQILQIHFFWVYT